MSLAFLNLPEIYLKKKQKNKKGILLHRMFGFLGTHSSKQTIEFIEIPNEHLESQSGNLILLAGSPCHIDFSL